jgi:hypothetical protein
MLVLGGTYKVKRKRKELKRSWTTCDRKKKYIGSNDQELLG